ncbi:MAG: restriction endonuclease [Bacteroidales bacterium]|nr:restriction endonuclease [Bacteroidales bacterium]
MNPNIEFELFAQRVYQKLLNSELIKPITVKHNVKLVGKSGCEHQIDVYWEYEVKGTIHKVVIECKNYNSTVPIGKVRDFFGVLYDLDGASGIMVSSKSFQTGAKKFAKHYGISLQSLRAPERNEPIGFITAQTSANIRHCLFLIDEEWAAEHKFDIQGLRNFYAQFQPNKADYWQKATHFPIETKDYNIRNSIGKVISSIETLERKLPQKTIPEKAAVFPFDDAWLDSRYNGPIKIREVMFEWESDVQEVTFNLAADDFVEGILKDAINGMEEYVSKY